jgi:hypothetical protein
VLALIEQQSVIDLELRDLIPGLFSELGLDPFEVSIPEVVAATRVCEVER